MTNQEERLKTLLYNAISLLLEKTCEEYDNIEEWLNMLTKELGCSLSELKEYVDLICKEL